MKIRNNSRILALVLALVMILPLISIPVFADGEQGAAPAPLFSENFDGKSLDDVAAGKPSSAQLLAAADTAHGDVLQITVAGVGTAPYYLWQNSNNKWPITGEAVNGQISGTANGKTIPATDVPADDNDESKTVTIDGTTYKIVTGTYADSMGGFNNVAAALKLKNPQILVADHSVITVKLDLFLPEGLKNTSGISGRMQGTKADNGSQNIELFEITADGTTATISKHENNTIALGEAKKVDLGSWVTLAFELDFTNKHITLLVNDAFAFRTSGIANGAADVIDVKADSLQVQIDRNGKPATNAGLVQFDNVSIVDGLSGITYNPYAINPLTIDFEEYVLVDAEGNTLAPEPKDSFSSSGFKIGVADSKVVDKFGSQIWEISFERPNGENKYNVDKNPQIKNPSVNYQNHDKIVYEVSYFFPTDAVGQIQNQFTGSTAFVGKDATSASSVSWVDLYQISFNNGVGVLKFESGSNEFVAAIKDQAGIDADNGKSYKFSVGKWNTVSLVLDLDTGIYEIYLNGELIFDQVQVFKGGVCKNITIAANQMITGGKVNKINGAGTFYLDNIKFFEGDKPSVEAVKKTAEDFEDFKWIVGGKAAGLSVPALATFETFTGSDNVVIKLPMQAINNEGLILLRADGLQPYGYQSDDGWVNASVVYDEENENYIYVTNGANGDEEWDVKVDEYTGLAYPYFFDEETGEEFALNDNFNNPDDYSDTAFLTYYIVPAYMAELSKGNGGQIAKALKIAHDKLSYADEKKIAVLTADYFIEAGSEGIIEAQFENYYYDVTTGEGEEAITETKTDGGWIQLYYFDLATGRFEGLNEFMKIGAWNTVKVFMDLESGEYEIYLNDALVKTESVGKTNLTIGANDGTTFSVAKIQRSNGELKAKIAGNLYIDNVGVSNTVPADSQYGDGFLSDEAYIENLSNMLITVVDPSLRLENPNGIRFATKLDNAFKENLIRNFGENAIASMGTLIAPLDYVEQVEAFTRGYLAEIEVEAGDKYMDIPFVEFFKGAEGVTFEEGEEVFTASIVNIKDANLMRDFAAVGYVIVNLPDGTQRTYYAKSYAVTSAAYEAKQAIANSETFDWTEEQQALLDKYAAADVDMEIYIESPVGNSKNPDYSLDLLQENKITVDGAYSLAGQYHEMIVTVVGAGEFSVVLGEDTFAAVEGVVTFTIPKAEGMMGRMPAQFMIVGNGEFTVSAVYPEGHANNPIVIEDLTAALNVSVPANSAVYYQWNANGAGVLTVAGSSEIGSILVMNVGLSIMEVADGVASVAVPYGVGDVIIIGVSTLGSEENPWETPAGEVGVAFTSVAASQIEAPMMPNQAPSIVTDIAAGEYAVFEGFAMMLAGKVFTMEAVDGVIVIYNGVMQPADEDGVISFVVAPSDNGACTFIFKNVGEAAASINAQIVEPVGSMNNPDALELTDTTATVGADGYHFLWTAEVTGTFTLTIDPACTNWTFVINNMTTSAYGEIHASNDETVVATESVNVTAGDQLMIVLGTADWTEAAVNFTVAFEAAPEVTA